MSSLGSGCLLSCFGVEPRVLLVSMCVCWTSEPFNQATVLPSHSVPVPSFIPTGAHSLLNTRSPLMESGA